MPWVHDPRFEPYAEFVEWVTEPEIKGGKERWVVMSRPWHGWPDPPEFAFFAQDAAGQVICGADFNRWPKAWIRPEKTMFEIVSGHQDADDAGAAETKPGDESADPRSKDQRSMIGE